MGIIIQFPHRSPVICSEITEAQHEAAQAALFGAMTACPRCADRGWIFFNRADGSPDALPCPCGGSDAERIQLDEVCA